MFKSASFDTERTCGERSRTSRSTQDKRGFTLIELLVAISIIAILSVVGFVSYQNVTSKAKDAKMKADIDAIKKAYETNYDPSLNNGQGGYNSLSAGNFANGKIPTPDGTSATSYLASGPDVTGVGNSTTGFAACATINGSNYCATSTQGSSSQPLITGTQAIPGTSCQDILTKSSGIADGVYWIKPDSNPAFQVYCDMTSDGGGWTLLMKARGDNGTFDYDTGYWTSNNTLIPAGDPNPNSNDDAKYQSFNVLPITNMRATWPDISSYKIQEILAGSPKTALSVFQGSQQDLSGSDPFAQFNQTYFPQQFGYKQYGFNLTCSNHAKVRWGWMMNNESTCESNDASAGIGLRLNYGTTMGGWSGCCSSMANGGYPKKVRIWGK